MTEVDARELDQLKRDAAAYRDGMTVVKVGAVLVVAALVIIMGAIFAFKALNPKLNLHKANIENQAVIKEQQAHSKAAEFAAQSLVTQAHAKAEATVIEATALAEAQRIIDATLTPLYVEYLYVKDLASTTNQVIYVPTEGGLPVLEAGRAVTTP